MVEILLTKKQMKGKNSKKSLCKVSAMTFKH